jgi:hypothetical protein
MLAAGMDDGVTDIRNVPEEFPQGLIDADELFDSLDDLDIDVLIDDDGEPTLLDADGRHVETWREGYPYDSRMTRMEYERTKRLLQIELLKCQYWVKETGLRLVLVFEGRDAAGKGGTIRRYTEHLNPRGARVVALEKPTENQRGQWYFQRYVEQLPSAGEIVFFDRSWYNRAGVERVMGFCTEEEYQLFMKQAPVFEQMLVEDGIVQVLVLGHPRRAAHPIHAAAGRPGQTMEAQPDGSRLAGQVGCLHRGEGADVSLHPHRARAVDRREEQ